MPLFLLKLIPTLLSAWSFLKKAESYKKVIASMLPVLKWIIKHWKICLSLLIGVVCGFLISSIFRSEPQPIVELDTQKVVISKPYPVYINQVIDCNPIVNLKSRDEIELNATLASQWRLLYDWHNGCVNSQIGSSNP